MRERLARALRGRRGRRGLGSRRSSSRPQAVIRARRAATPAFSAFSHLATSILCDSGNGFALTTLFRATMTLAEIRDLAASRLPERYDHLKLTFYGRESRLQGDHVVIGNDYGTDLCARLD